MSNHTHVCQFFNIFLLRLAFFSEHTPESDFNTHESDFSTQSVFFKRSGVTSTRMNVIVARLSMITTRRVCFQHARPANVLLQHAACDFKTNQLQLT
jgi:hypothetical protein